MHKPKRKLQIIKFVVHSFYDRMGMKGGIILLSKFSCATALECRVLHHTIKLEYASKLTLNRIEQALVIKVRKVTLYNFSLAPLQPYKERWISLLQRLAVL